MAKTTNKAGLVKGQDDAIYVEKDIFENNWKVLRTKTKGCNATVMFTFENEIDAMIAGAYLADAIGGTFYGITDPRKI